MIRLKAGLVIETSVYFERELSEIIVASNNALVLQKIQEQLYSFQEEEYVKNPLKECINHIAFMLDASSSMKLEERKKIKQNIENWLGLMNAKQHELSISIFMFDNEAESLINRIAISNRTEIESALKSYIEVHQKRHTDWSTALSHLLEFSEKEHPDLIVFLTDAPPNYLNAKETTGVVSLSHTSNSANQIKAMGIRLVAIGTDKFNNQNAHQWFPFISGFEQRSFVKDGNLNIPVTIHKNNYIVLDYYDELEDLLKDINSQCSIDPQDNQVYFDIYPNPSVDLFNLKLKLPNANNYSLEILDFLGRRVWTKEQINYTEQIAVHDWPAGTYYLQCVEKQSRNVIGAQQLIKL